MKDEDADEIVQVNKERVTIQVYQMLLGCVAPFRARSSTYGTIKVARDILPGHRLLAHVN